jgi:hypothetical protein
MTDTPSEIAADLNKDWQIDITDPKGRLHQLKVGKIETPAVIGQCVTKLLERLLEAAPSKDDRPIETIPGIPPAIQPERQAKA